MLNEGQEIVFDRKKTFKYIKSLGYGGTGDTHLFKDETTDMFFAIKKYAPKYGNDIKENYSRFVDEIKILFQISHPNVVRIYNYYLYPEFTLGYLQMEYVKGKPIDQVTQDDLFLSDWNDIFEQTISAFRYLEAHHILHRDIRPSNIMITDTDDIKIIDFGFGKIVDPKVRENNSILLNWPATQMPEEIEQQGEYNHCTEVYYLGTLFRHLDLGESFKFNFILDKMTQVKVSNRYQSFSDISQAMSQGILATLDFTKSQHNAYLAMAEALSTHIAEFKETPSFENNEDKILSSLEKVIKSSALEEKLQDERNLIRCFVISNCSYYSKKDIPISTIANFYKFYSSLNTSKRRVVIDNLVSRLSVIKVEIDDDDLPF
jgi:serine/threonine protein kinase